jgi:putative ABC transport system substrate-binding protein
LNSCTVFSAARFLRQALCLLWVLLCPLIGSAANVQKVRIAVSEDSVLAKEIAARLVEILGRIAPELPIVTVSDFATPDTSKYLAVTVGDSALVSAAGVVPRSSPVLAVIPQAATYEAALKRGITNTSVIYLNQPISRMLNLAKLIESENSTVGIIAGPLTQPLLTLAESAAAERNLRIISESVSDESAVGRAVSRIASKANILLATPDPVAHTTNTVQPVLLSTYRAGIPVIGYSAAYLRAGATIALYSNAEQIAQQVAETIVSFHQGKPLPSVQAPHYFTVTVNTTVARSLGIGLPSASELQEKLRTMKE